MANQGYVLGGSFAARIHHTSISSNDSNTVVGDVALKQQFTDKVMGYLSLLARLFTGGLQHLYHAVF